ncbi:GAF domain-containing protein [Salibacter halophilus]|uniref:histidine kinase n=1 Tax=Salibacter halophilus TaxID=1803916 RepID=A0A6N6M5L9_9FLAO|nr:GAF domain-containing protein [Salibacter halophilus]KAB1064909.1 GAF domain-containing protein [Salibacter halophilus]
MNSRLEDVYSYELLDTPSEKELDEITELASIICDAPISLITILDDKRQWFKSNKGLDINETKIEDSFCRHTLHKPDEILVVNDALKDDHFIENKLVFENPNIRFYAGVPLVTKRNNVLGTLCIIDRKPREFSRDQERALKILAKKAMDKIESRKQIKNLTKTVDFNTDRLVKLTENLPIGIFEMIVSKSGDLKFSFLSEGMKKLHPESNLEDWLEDASIGFSLMHPEDVEGLREALVLSVKEEKNVYHEYRVKRDSGYDWHAIHGYPMRTENGDTIIYGSFTDITQHLEYEETLEQIAFDISHVLRRPVTTLLGLSELIESEHKLSFDKLNEYSGYIKTVTEELEKFTRRLEEIYSKKKHTINSRNNRA